MIRRILKYKNGHPLGDDFAHGIYTGTLLDKESDMCFVNEYYRITNNGECAVLVAIDAVEVVDADEEDDLSSIGFEKIGGHWFNMNK